MNSHSIWDINLVPEASEFILILKGNSIATFLNRIFITLFMKLVNFALIFLVLASVMVFAQETPAETPADVPNETVAPVEPTLTCSQNQCDKGCVKCSDRVCHEPGFECVEKITLDKMFPSELEIGTTQINLLIRNTGTVDLKEIFAEITGDGISTVERISIPKLPAGEKDYAFTKINVEKSGLIDVVIKVYVDGELKGKLVDSFEVAKPISTEPVVNVTMLGEEISRLKQKYNLLESLYQQKKNDGYPVDLTYDKLKQASDYVTSGQGALVEGDYKKVQASIVVLQSLLPDIETQLNSAVKQEESFGEKIKDNLLFFGSIAAAIISIITALTLVKSHVANEKLIARLGKKKAKEIKKKEKVKKAKEDDKTDEE